MGHWSLFYSESSRSNVLLLNSASSLIDSLKPITVWRKENCRLTTARNALCLLKNMLHCPPSLEDGKLTSPSLEDGKLTSGKISQTT